jgi:Na+-driven multidrug efflux pump
VSVVLCLAYIALRARLLIPSAQHFAPDAALWGELAGQGFSMGFMSSIVSTGSVILQYGINGLGTLVIAGHTAARKLFSFTAMPFMAMSTATSTFVSQNRGADQPARIRKGLRQIYLYCVLCAAVLSVVVLFAAEPMVRLISGSSEPVVLQNGARYLIFATPFYSVLGVLISTRCALQGLGQKLLPLVSSCIELVGKILFVLVFIPRFAYTAVIFCEPTIWCVMTAQLLLSFYRDPYIRAAKRSEQAAADDRQAA